jgi:beta-glucosidase
MTTSLRSSLRVTLLSLWIASSCCAWVGSQTPTRPNAQLASKEVNAHVEALLRQMTLEEKVGQLV